MCITGQLVIMQDSVPFYGSVYLVKIRATKKYGSRDLLWALGQKMKDPLDFEGMRGLVTETNNLGLLTPKISEDVITWGQIKAQVAVQATSQVGKPITLLENVHSFYQIMYFAYDAFVLKEEAGLKLLDSLSSGKEPSGVDRVKGSDKTVTEAREEAAVMAKEHRERVVKKEGLGGE